MMQAAAPEAVPPFIPATPDAPLHAPASSTASGLRRNALRRASVVSKPEHGTTDNAGALKQRVRLPADIRSALAGNSFAQE